MKRNIILCLTLFLIPTMGFTQIYEYEESAAYEDWDSYSVEEFYEKIEVKSGTKDEDGDDISFVFVPSDLEQGLYRVEIADGAGDLYHIKGTEYYIEFRGYYGYAGYEEEGVLEVGYSAYNSTFYKKE